MRRLWCAPRWTGPGPRACTGLDRARAEGVHRVVLEVAHENRRAWAFYERLGFRATGRVATMPWDDSVTEEEMALEVGVPWPGARPAS
jgi:hypothetical protein